MKDNLYYLFQGQSNLKLLCLNLIKKSFPRAIEMYLDFHVVFCFYFLKIMGGIVLCFQKIEFKIFCREQKIENRFGCFLDTNIGFSGIFVINKKLWYGPHSISLCLQFTSSLPSPNDSLSLSQPFHPNLTYTLGPS